MLTVVVGVVVVAAVVVAVVSCFAVAFVSGSWFRWWYLGHVAKLVQHVLCIRP